VSNQTPLPVRPDDHQTATSAPSPALSVNRRDCTPVFPCSTGEYPYGLIWLESCLLARSELMLDRLAAPKTATRQPHDWGV
jgi:hypothetical protein